MCQQLADNADLCVLIMGTHHKVDTANQIVSVLRHNSTVKLLTEHRETEKAKYWVKQNTALQKVDECH